MSTNSGAEAIEGDGGNTTVHCYYCGTPGGMGVSPVNWQILETRNGSNQATRQWAWGFQYVDEPIFMDVNRAPTHGNDCDPDVEEGGGNNDARYYYQQDRNWNVVAVLESDFPAAGGYAAGVAGRVAERYAYTPYGEFVVLRGDSGSGQLGYVLVSSYVGSPFAHQGLGWDAEKESYQNRWREHLAKLQRFGQRDPLPLRTVADIRSAYPDGANLYVPARNIPTGRLDSSGQGSYTCGPKRSHQTVVATPPVGPPPAPPSGNTTTCDGRGRCQAQLNPGWGLEPEPVRGCVISHECVHCRHRPITDCCGKMANTRPPALTNPEWHASECAAYSDTANCTNASEPQCLDYLCILKLRCMHAHAQCKKEYHCNPSHNIARLNQCLWDLFNAPMGVAVCRNVRLPW